MNAVADHNNLFRLIGLYHVHWSSFELAIDIGITKLTGLTAAQTVKRTQGWMISKKVDYLKKLVEQSAYQDKIGILDILAELPATSARNAMAHGYLRFGADRLIVIHRSRAGKPTRLDYTTTDFDKHLKLVSDLAAIIHQPGSMPC